MPKSKLSKKKVSGVNNYSSLVGSISTLLDSARRTSARTVNIILTSAYWEIGRRIIEFEQKGADRARYGNNLLKNLSLDLKPFGRGFSVDNLELMRLFYFNYPLNQISETVSRKLKSKKSETLSRKFNYQNLNNSFPLPWSHYVMLIRRVKDNQARKFYEKK